MKTQVSEPTVSDILFWATEAQKTKEESWNAKSQQYRLDLEQAVEALCPCLEWLKYCEMVESLARVFWNEIQTWNETLGAVKKNKR